jgi:N-acetylmuramoyl-L-alanine amidase
MSNQEELKEASKVLRKALNEVEVAFTKGMQIAWEQMHEIDKAIKAMGDAPKAQDLPINTKSNGVSVYVNWGHGDFVNGKYLTFAHHGKYYSFLDRQGKLMETAYEGYWNRVYGKRLGQKLTEAGFRVFYTGHNTQDRENWERTNLANNDYNVEVLPKKGRAVWLGIHFNAHGMENQGQSIEARGASHFTSRGKTESDLIATVLWKHFKAQTQRFKIAYREDLRDGDGDYEGDYQEVLMTVMPAMIFETLFFTNWEDYQLIKNNEFMEAVTDAWVMGLKEYYQV